MKQAKYDVFISYSRKDYVDEHNNEIPGNVVSKFKDALTRAGVTYWFDKDGNYSGQNFLEKIGSSIENSKIFLFLSTENANKSSWTCKEIAYANKLNKQIIPVRIDSSPFNSKYNLLLVDLDYIEYYKNHEEGMKDLIKSIKSFLEEQAQADKQKAEEETRRKEQLKLEQEQLISELNLSCSELNHEEAKIESKRNNLIARVKQILNLKQREQLVELISAGGAIHKKYQEKLRELTDELKKYQEKLKELTGELNLVKTKELGFLKLQIQQKEKEISDLKADLQKKNVINPPKTSNKKQTIYVATIVIVSIIASICLLYALGVSQEINETQTTLNETQTTLNLVSDLVSTPILITDIEVKNEGENWGDIIYSDKSTYIMPRINYVGLKAGSFELSIKIFDKEGELCQGSSSPHDCSYLEEISVSLGKNSEELKGWGNDKLGNWSSGDYRIEVWYNNNKLAEKEFYVYP
ncbi:MAG: TIR domain-containing protein [bacterium]|nr:TIR domain-containing protein [bacterium]